MNSITRIPKFRRCVLQNFPFIEQDFDALTDYELLCKVVEYLNKVINSQNEVIAQTEQLVSAFNTLQSYVENYFANLDVQEEINNKLDEMAEDGQLADIISQYLNSTAVFGYDNVSGMKVAENLVNGSYARTLGYYNRNDGGGALYKIRTVTNDDVVDEAKIIELSDNSLVAELIVTEPLNVKQLGVKGDGVTDDTTKLQIALDSAHSVYIPNGTYMVDATATSKTDTTAGLVVKSNTDIKLAENAILKAIPNSVEWYSILHLYHVSNVNISGGKIVGDRDNHTYNTGTDEWGAGIKCIGTENITIRDIEISECTGDGIEIGNFASGETNKNITIDNCVIDGVRRNGISIEIGDGFKIINTKIINVNGTAPQLAIDLEPNNYLNDSITNVLIDNCYIDNCTSGGVSCWRADHVTISNCYVKVPNNKISVSVLASSATSQTNKDIKVVNNTIDSNGTGWYMIGSNAITSANNFSNTNIYLTESQIQSIENSLFTSNTVKDGLFKTYLGSGSYTISCKDVIISNNDFSYTLSGTNVDPTSSALDGLQYEFGTRDASGGKKIAGIKITGNVFEYLNTSIFTTPVTYITNKTSFDLGLLNSEFTNNTLKNIPYAMLCSKLPNVNISNNKFYNLGFLWAYRAVSIQNDNNKLLNFTNNIFIYDGSTPANQVVYINGLNHIVGNTLQSSTAVPDCFLKLQDGSISYAYNNFALSSTTNGCISCYTNGESLHGANNI